ncbi:MAG: hypothetical protein HKN12_09915, partial [Gemmatimonadetes bacterium]|nr:hypothetical protein [Gemmatimonadota bacterium]
MTQSPDLPPSPKPPAPERSTAVLVLGMHRSGTSALTRILNLLGVELGGSLMRAAAGNNSTGFWEHQDLVDLHDELLEHVGSRWDDPRPLDPDRLLADDTRPIRDRMLAVVQRDFSDQPLWGLKDPRLCRLLPVWKELLDRAGCDVRYVLTARHPAEVAASLERRDGFPAALSHLLWMEHCLAAERETRGAKRVFVTYDDLMADWRGTAARIGAGTGCDWEARLDEVAPQVAEFLNPELRHHRTTALDGLHVWIRAVWSIWREATQGGD